MGSDIPNDDVNGKSLTYVANSLQNEKNVIDSMLYLNASNNISMYILKLRYSQASFSRKWLHHFRLLSRPVKTLAKCGFIS